MDPCEVASIVPSGENDAQEASADGCSILEASLIVAPRREKTVNLTVSVTTRYSLVGEKEMEGLATKRS